MKIQLWIMAGLFGMASLGFSEGLDANIDYLHLTRASLPAPSTMIDGCLSNLDFDPQSYAEYSKKRKMAAWLPLIHVGGEVQENRYNDYEHVDNFQVSYKADSGTANPLDPGQTFSGYQQTGYNDAYIFDVWAQWDLRELIYSLDTQQGVGSATLSENERHFLYAEVSKRYGKLYSLLPEKTGTKIPASKAVRIIENAAVLDAMSGYLITEAIKAEQVAADEPVVYANGASLDLETEVEEEEPAIIEVDDGQDDTTEKAF